MYNLLDERDYSKVIQDRLQCSWYVQAIMAVAGTVAQMAGNAQQNSAAQKAAKEQERLIEAETALNEANTAKQNDIILAKNQARNAASGVNFTSGSPLEHDLAQAFNAGMQEATIRWEGDVRKRNVKLGAKQTQQAYRAKQTETAIKGIGSAISAYSSGGGNFSSLGSMFSSGTGSAFGPAGSFSSFNPAYNTSNWRFGT